MISIPIDEQSVELAQREEFFNITRDRRVSTARALIKECSKCRKVRVLHPYYTFEGQRRYRKVLEERPIHRR